MTANSYSVILLALSSAIYAILIGWRRQFYVRVGEQGFLLLCGFVSSFVIPATAWALGLSSAFNDPYNPVMRGTGGYYGVNYQYFPQAILIYMIIPVAAMALTALFPPKLYNVISRDIIGQIGGALRLHRIAYLALLASILLTLWYFYVIGWGRFWHSDLSRFEFDAGIQEDFGLKIVLTLILAFGCLGTTLAAFRGLLVRASIIVFISSLPFVAFASRGMSVLAVGYCVALFYRVTRPWRWVVWVPMMIFVYFSLRLPLMMRNNEQTGIRSAIESVFVDEQAPDSGFINNVAGSLQNVGQGFGLLVEERESEATGHNIVTGIPMTYFVLSISPTLSAIDGFADKWLSYHPRQNVFTPYSGLCEVVAVNSLGGAAFFIFIYWISAWICRRASGVSLWHDVGLFAFSLIVVLGFLQLQQYPLRNGMRFIYAGFALFFSFQALAFLARTSQAGRPLLRAVGLFSRAAGRGAEKTDGSPS